MRTGIKTIGALLMATASFGQTRVQLSQIRNLSQISPAPVSAAKGGTQINLSQVKWPGFWFDLAQIMDMIAQANTGRVFLYSFQGAKVYEQRSVDYNDLQVSTVVTQNPFYHVQFGDFFNTSLFTAESLQWYRQVVPLSSDLLTHLPAQ